MTNVTKVEAPVTTELALMAIAYERAPRHNSFVNRRVVCADGYRVSVQASSSHYAEDMGPRSPYWRGVDPIIAYPFVSFEVGGVDDSPTPESVWDHYESGGVWAWVPHRVVADLLDAHGGVVAWEESE